MKKLFKSLALVLAVAVCAVCMGVFASACDSNKFTITVLYSDGTAVDGTKDPLKVQICSADLIFCYIEQPVVDAEGKVTFDIDDIENVALSVNAGTTFVIHVLETGNINPLTLSSEVTVNRSNPTATVKLADRLAP